MYSVSDKKTQSDGIVLFSKTQQSIKTPLYAFFIVLIIKECSLNARLNVCELNEIIIESSAVVYSVNKPGIVGSVAKSSTSGLVGTGLAFRYRQQPGAGVFLVFF